MQISIIIPVLNELDVIQHQLDAFNKLEGEGHQLIFVDGESSDGSYEFLYSRFDHVYRSPPCRATQMNKGASCAVGNTLVFLHVDTAFVSACLSELDKCQHNWGFFSIRLSGAGVVYRMIESGINIRSRVFNVATGDQTLFFSREFFDRLGGFPSIELMEDIELARRAKRVFKPYILDDTVISSSRRWERNGPIKTVLFMWYLQGLFKIGVRPFKLAEMYRSGDWFNFKREKL